MTWRASPFQPFLDHQGVVILDGGLATALEAHGHRLDTDLWSARMLIDAPEEVAKVHRAFLDAGADCIATASYQASYPGFAELGLGEEEVDELLLRSVALAWGAVDDFWSDSTRHRGRLRPLVAASVGPYGAYLADGSEYDGRYGVGEAELDDFHRRRFELLVASDADLVACETIPSIQEADVLLRLFAQSPDAWGWISFSCRDGEHLNDGTPVEMAVDLCERAEGLVGVGVNCTAPSFIGELIARMRDRTDRPIIVYPNSGEEWDAENNEWLGRGSTEDWVDMAGSWLSSGAKCVGGCCRIGPELIEELRRRVVVSSG